MKTIKNNVWKEIIIKNSRFICYLYKIEDVSMVKECLESLKLKYKDASHYCYSYIIDDKIKSSDDGEPGGTAGIPILQVLEKNNLNYVLAIVIRYFGGIKLGAGGLVRAYTKSVSEVLGETMLVDLISGYNVTIQFSYNKVKEVDYLLRNVKIINKEFKDVIKYNLDVDEKLLKEIKNNKIEIIKITNKIISL